MYSIDFWSVVKVTIPPLASGLVAAFIVHLLTQSRERERWLLDCKRQEFKELLSAVAEAYVTTLRVYGPIVPFMLSEPSEEQSVSLAENNALRIMRDRLYIAEDLPLKRMSNDWLMALQHYRRLRDPESLHFSYDLIKSMIIYAANKSVPKTTFERLQFWKGILARRRSKGKLAVTKMKTFE